MKRTWIILSLAGAALVAGPMTTYADHDKDCKGGTHGKVSAKTSDSITVNGKTYMLDSNATVTKEDGAALGIAGVNVGDKVCLQTTSSDSKEVSKLMVLDKGHASTSDTAAANTAVGSDQRTYAREKLNEVEEKAHEKMCTGHHGTVTDKTANSVTIDGTTYALSINTPVNKQEEPLLTKTMKVGDRVCFVTKEAADGSRQITKLMAIDRDADSKVRVREHDTDTDVKVKSSPSKVEVETPNHEIEVK